MQVRDLVLLMFLVGCEVHPAGEVRLVSRTQVIKRSTTAFPIHTVTMSGPTPIADGGRIVLPAPLKRVEPTFAERPRTAVTFILVEAIVTARGDVANVKILKGGNDSDARAVADAVRQWKFRPGTVDGKPVDMTYQLTVNI